MLEVCPT